MGEVRRPIEFANPLWEPLLYVVDPYSRALLASSISFNFRGARNCQAPGLVEGLLDPFQRFDGG